MNKQGKSIIGFFFFIVAFIFLWIIWLAKYLSILGQMLIVSSSAIGIEAWTYANLNLFVLIALIILIIGGGAFGNE